MCLPEILSGGVYVDQNKFLCHADTIHWRDIIKNPQAELLVVPSNNSNLGCECPPDQTISKQGGEAAAAATELTERLPPAAALFVLREILSGGVYVDQNKFLCHADTIHWRDIIKNPQAELLVVPSNNSNLGCECPPDQTISKQGGEAAAAATELTERLPPAAALFVLRVQSKTALADKTACTNFNDSGACVTQCPQPVVYSPTSFQLEHNPRAKYTYGAFCVKKCPRSLQIAQTVDASNIQKFVNCTKINGNLIFLITGIKGDIYHGIGALDPERLNVFRTVKEITALATAQKFTDVRSYC
ncbi:hypothetical protein CRUP_024145 [Coryphaenoides rupestris]|nr:hypothetical protein CRUP_024145 [Coryphaenoides rupestris]